MDNAPKGYVICTAPRSGSTLLCTLLRATGVAGWPESHFYGPTPGHWAKGLGLGERADLGAILAAAQTKGRAGGPVFALRQQWPSFPQLLATLAAHRPEATDHGRLEGALGPLRYIHLSRPDKLGQALSYIRAEQTGIWHRNADGSIYEENPQRRTDGYDAEAIGAQIATFAEHDAGWRAWFAGQGITPLSLTYDGLAEDPVGTLKEVLSWIGLDPKHADGVRPPTRKLADDVSPEWAARYRAQTGGLGS